MLQKPRGEGVKRGDDNRVQLALVLGGRSLAEVNDVVTELMHRLLAFVLAGKMYARLRRAKKTFNVEIT